MTVPRVPTQSTELEGWLNSVEHAVMACASDGTKAWRWVREVKDPKAELGDFRLPGKAFTRLDRKLAQAITERLGSTSSVAQYLDQQARQWEERRDAPLSGRQILWLICDYYAVSEVQSKMFTMRELEGVKWQGDSKMEDFLNAWSRVYDGLKVKPDPLYVRDLFIERLRNSKKECISIVQKFEDAEEGEEHRGYAWLHDALQKRIKMHRDQRNRAAIARNILGEDAAPAPSPPRPEPKPKPQPKQKAGGKGAGKGGQEQPSQERGRTSKRPCYKFATTGSCDKDPCLYEHRAFTAEEKAEFDKLQAARSPSPASRKKEKGPAKIKCRFFFKPGGCKNGDTCTFSHDEKFRKAADTEETKQ